MELAVLLSVLAGGLGLLALILVRERPAGGLQTVELRFGGEVSVSAVEALLGCIAGLPARAVVQLDVVGDSTGIRHFAHAAPETLETLRGQWRAVLPGLRLDSVDERPSVKWRAGGLLRLAGAHPVLRTDGVAESAASMLGSLQPLSSGERVLIRWMVKVGSRPTLPPTVSSAARSSDRLGGEPGVSAAHLRTLQHKCDGPVLSAVGVLAVAAGHPRRAAHLASRVLSPLRARAGGYGRITLRSRSAKRMERLLERLPWQWDLYSPSELAPVLGLPVGAPQLPGLALDAAPQLMPSPRIPSEGRVLAVSTWPGEERRLAQPVAGATSHTLVAGPTGVGKSSLISALAIGDAAAGRGFLVVDGKGGDLADDILSRLPAARHRDVIVLDTGTPDLPIPGLQVFGRGADIETTAELVLGVFSELFAASWGPMSARWLRAGLIAVAHDPEGTLADLPFVFRSDSYRRRLVGLMDDVLLKGVFADFERMSASERTHQMSAALNKTEELIGRRVVRSVLAQTKPAIDMHEVLREGKIVIVSVSPARVGPAARLIAALVVYKLHEAVMARAALPAAARTPFFFYCDEPAVLKDVPVPLDGLFEMARSANVGVVLSAQSLTQLPSDLRSAATTNANSWVVFRQASGDAKLLAPELPGVSPEALQQLGQYEAVLRIALGPGDVAAPVTGRTLPPSAPTGDPQALRRLSAEHYGADPAEVDAALARRHQIYGQEEPAVGLVRRAS